MPVFICHLAAPLPVARNPICGINDIGTRIASRGKMKLEKQEQTNNDPGLAGAAVLAKALRRG
jgi:hypothetical protein